MFRKNQDYNNPRLFPNESHYPKYIQKRLKTHWSTVFFEELFSKIDESVMNHFSAQVKEDQMLP